MAVCEEAGRRYRDTCLLLCEKGEKREHMKKFYAWYQKHITGAIFTGLILGILTGLLLADRHRRHLHERLEYDDFPDGILLNCHGYLQHRKCKNDR